MVTHPAAGVGIPGKDTSRINNVLCGPERPLTIPELCEETSHDEYESANGAVTWVRARQHLKWHLERNDEPNRPQWAGAVQGTAFVRGLDSNTDRSSPINVRKDVWWIDPVKAEALPPRRA